MPSLIGLRRRIRSAKNIRQITKAMEMVSASKMRKSQEQALATRPFSQKLEGVLQRISASTGNVSHPLFRKSDSPKKAMIIIISTDKGLCGPLNINLFRTVSQWSENESDHSHLKVVHVRKRAKTPPLKAESELVAVFHDIGETPTFQETRAIARLAMDAFGEGTVDEVYIAYSEFVSTLVNRPVIKRVLPVMSEGPEIAVTNEYTFEPSTQDLMQELVPYMVEMTFYQTMIDASASEHSSRMVAMKNASDNAHDLIGSLTLDYNQARQSQVTSELSDATTARMALE